METWAAGAAGLLAELDVLVNNAGAWRQTNVDELLGQGEDLVDNFVSISSSSGKMRMPASSA